VIGMEMGDQHARRLECPTARAVAGLVRTRRGHRAGRAAAIGGLVLACAWAAAGAAVAAAGSLLGVSGLDPSRVLELRLLGE